MARWQLCCCILRQIAQNFNIRVTLYGTLDEFIVVLRSNPIDNDPSNIQIRIKSRKAMDHSSCRGRCRLSINNQDNRNAQLLSNRSRRRTVFVRSQTIKEPHDSFDHCHISISMPFIVGPSQTLIVRYHKAVHIP